MFWRCVSVGVECFGTVRACRGVVLVRVGFLLTPKSDKNPVWGFGVLLWAFCGGWLIGMNYCCVSRQAWAGLG